MFIRYKNGADGLDAVAQVYSKEENKIDPNLIDRNAVSVVKRLTGAGYESYIVGGAVRDLILGRIPKDFDVATSASPRQVHKLFYNSRIIGRRFRIVHITYGDEIIEVSTFRSTRDHDYTNDNQFGTIEEDCTRRDFTINSLYYDPIKGNLIDFNNALEDFKNKKIVSLIPLNRTFIEDPVRMVRAVKYSVTTGFKIPFRLSMAIRHYAPMIGQVSSSRMTEEVNKILSCGNSSEIFSKLNQYKLLVHILPAMSVYTRFPQMFDSLKELDQMVNDCKDGKTQLPRAKMYLALVRPFIAKNEEWTTPTAVFNDILRQIKVMLSPITPPNYELEMAASMYMEELGMKVPKSCIRHRNPALVQKQQKSAKAQPKRRNRTKKVKTTPERAD
ncbi:MAG: polynucleotide adenylyltransferase PcnB [Spirochaetales bacterium]